MEGTYKSNLMTHEHLVFLLCFSGFIKGRGNNRKTNALSTFRNVVVNVFNIIYVHPFASQIFIVEHCTPCPSKPNITLCTSENFL